MRYLIYYKEVSLDVGFEILSKDKENRLVNGKKVSSPSGLSLYQALRSSNQPLKCWECGIDATCFVANKGQNDKVSKPVLDLFAELDGKYVLMTRDHIIPRSLGGINDVENLRVGCQPCNSARGNSMNEEDLKFMENHPRLVKIIDKAPVVQKTEVTVDLRLRRVAFEEATAKRYSLRKKFESLPPLSSMLALALA